MFSFCVLRLWLFFTLNIENLNNLMMDCSEKVLCGSGEVDLDPNIVSEEAGKLYSELQVRSCCFLF